MTMHTQYNLELRSEEIQELLTKVPSLILRWGITALFLCMLLGFAFSYYLKVPEKINGDFVFKQSQIGYLSVPVENSGLIKKGQTVLLELDNFPGAKFGTITTIVDSLSFDDIKNKYIVHTQKMDSLQTNFGITLPKLPYITGKGAVIIDETRAINKLMPFLNF